MLYERRVQDERVRLYADLQQQFSPENMQKFMFTGLLRSFSGDLLIRT